MSMDDEQKMLDEIEQLLDRLNSSILIGQAYLDDLDNRLVKLESDILVEELYDFLED
jgi:hypothetical protein